MQHIPYGPYERFIKRPLDLFLSICALFILSPILVAIAILVRIKLGSPILFTQARPGKDEKIFKLYKFRSMTNKKNENGDLLPDEMRITKFGKSLRATSLDELPELINIIMGDMALVGPRPQLVRDMVFMTKEQRMRHSVKPGLSGLAQINGRNEISWEKKLDWDLKYIERITFWGDCHILLHTIIKAFIQQEGITKGNMTTSEDYGDYLLNKNRISRAMYDKKQKEANALLKV